MRNGYRRCFASKIQFTCWVSVSLALKTGKFAIRVMEVPTFRNKIILKKFLRSLEVVFDLSNRANLQKRNVCWLVKVYLLHHEGRVHWFTLASQSFPPTLMSATAAGRK